METLSANILAVIFGFGEIGVLCLGAMGLFLRWGNTFAEAAVYALITPLMALSFLFQLHFLLGIPYIVPVGEACLWLAAGWSLWRDRRYLTGGYRAGRWFFSAHRLPAGLLLAVWGYLVVRSVVIPTSAMTWEPLGRVMDWQAAGSFFGAQATISAVPVNVMVLPHLFLRFGTHAGVGLFGLMAYLAIGFATYSLARRHAWPPTAFTITLVTVSLPRLVTLASSPGVEIVPAAAAVFCLLVLYRLVERPSMYDLALLILGLCFCMPAEEICFLLPMVLLLLSLVLLIRRHGVLIWSRAIRFHPWATLAMVPATIVFSQVWLFAANLVRTGSWNGNLPSSGFTYNVDGIQGALANLLRYLLQIAHFTEPFDRLLLWAFGFRISDMLQGIYNQVGRPFFGGLGAASAFRISWLVKGSGVWFGPFAFFLIVPALAYALTRGSRRLKATSLALTGYVYLVCLVCAWTPANAKFFTPVFACGGFCSAFFLPPWRFTKTGQRAIQAISLVLMVYTAACLDLPLPF